MGRPRVLVSVNIEKLKDYLCKSRETMSPASNSLHPKFLEMNSRLILIDIYRVVPNGKEPLAFGKGP